MAFIQSPRKHIELRVNDLTRGDTKLGQVARVVGQGWEQPSATSVMAVAIKLELLLFALNGTELGAPLAEDPRFTTLTKTLDGQNDTLVDADTGEILGIQGRTPGTADPADWGAFCRSFTGRDTTLQGDYFEKKRAMPVVTELEILHHLQAAFEADMFV